jgi:hypothetical protein
MSNKLPQARIQLGGGQGFVEVPPQPIQYNAVLSCTITISFAGPTAAFSAVGDVDRSYNCSFVGIQQPVNINQAMYVEWTLDTPIPPDDRITIASFNLTVIGDLDPLLPIPPIVLDGVADSDFVVGVPLNGQSQVQGSPDVVFDLHILLLFKTGTL